MDKKPRGFHLVNAMKNLDTAKTVEIIPSGTHHYELERQELKDFLMSIPVGEIREIKLPNSQEQTCLRNLLGAVAAELLPQHFILKSRKISDRFFVYVKEVDPAEVN